MTTPNCCRTGIRRRYGRRVGRSLAPIMVAAGGIAFAAGLAYGQPPVFAGAHHDGGVVRVAARDSFEADEIIATGHRFFGQISGNLASVVERIFARFGKPNGYILGEEGSGAVIGGLRYGEGTLTMPTFGSRRVYWQGPSLGWDFGGDGARVMMLVYDLPAPEGLYRRFAGVDGSAYVVGGLGFTVLAADTTILVPVRSGVGARLGLAVGYLKFTRKPTWNPF